MKRIATCFSALLLSLLLTFHSPAAMAQATDNTNITRTNDMDDNDGDAGRWGLAGLLGLLGLLGLRRRDDDRPRTSTTVNR